MSAYTVRVAAASVQPNTTVQLWTCPAEDAWVLRDLIVVNTAGVVGSISVGLRPVSGPAYWLFVNGAMASQTSSHSDLRQRVAPAEKLEVATGAASMTVLLTAYQLKA